MELVPYHLRNTHDFLQRLHSVPPDQRLGMQFCSADVENLYTNINVPTAIQDVIEFAAEHRQSLDLLGLKLVDIQRLLEIILGNSYFLYNSQVYRQLQGLFMGSRPAPVLATIRLYKLEQRSIYTDLRLRSKFPFYCRFYDDGGALTLSCRNLQLLCNRIEQEDETGLIKLTTDFPENGNYTPFLNTEVRIETDGTINTRLYRKPQKKLLTLNYNSHHAERTKEATVTSMYSTADAVSSSTANKIYSCDLVDQLLLNNGYNGRVIQKLKEKRKKKKKKRKGKNKKKNNHAATLKIPHLSDQCTADIDRAAKQCFLPIRVVSTPGKTLRDTLTSSRPLDKPLCPRDDCRTCSSLRSTPGNTYSCTVSNVVYEVKCKLCGMTYNGETYRPLHKRFTEHYYNANNPTASSYINTPLAKHYREHHPNSESPELSLRVLERASDTVNRKIREARLIACNRPIMNDRQELSGLRQFLVQHNITE